MQATGLMKIVPSATPASQTLTNRKATRQSGFTLIEVLIVMAILALIFGLIVPQLAGRQEGAQVDKAKIDMSSLENVLEMYRVDNNHYPSTEQTLQALVSKPNGFPEPKRYNSGGYLKRLQKDPWGNDYIYQSPGEHGDFDIITFGADGRPGGEEANADIGNWQL